ncbi:small ribosomal subunit protein mS26 [Hetaerina americana]|uniref:small ribosomal subunit protein mS26 n=1 Tax=Hetaerina americana TaxID=62018 RepID=UPI003A7F34BA
MFSQFKSGVLTAYQSVYYGDTQSIRAFLQFVRWNRKPIWAPIAKSKLFRIPERKRLPEDEDREIRRLFNIYRTQMKSIRTYLEKEYQKSEMDLPEQNTNLEEEEFSQALKVNDLWNKEIEGIRAQRLAKEEEEARNEILERMILSDQEAQERIKLLDSVVKQEKAKSSTFITPEKLDEAIEYALANPVDYNYCIDLEGNYIYGLKGKLEVARKAEDQQISTSQ